MGSPGESASREGMERERGERERERERERETQRERNCVNDKHEMLK